MAYALLAGLPPQIEHFHESLAQLGGALPHARLPTLLISGVRENDNMHAAELMEIV